MSSPLCLHDAFSGMSRYLEGSPTICSFDYVEIRDGPSSASPLMGKWCGSGCEPPQVATTGNAAYVKFRTDGSVVYAGFKMKYEGGCRCVYERCPSQSTLLPSWNLPPSLVMANIRFIHR